MEECIKMTDEMQRLANTLEMLDSLPDNDESCLDTKFLLVDDERADTMNKAHMLISLLKLQLRKLDDLRYLSVCAEAGKAYDGLVAEIKARHRSNLYWEKELVKSLYNLNSMD